MEQWRMKEPPHLEVEAVRLNEDNVSAVAAWAGNAQVVEEISPEHPDETQAGLNVPTQNGNTRASLGMYVVKFGRVLFVEHVRPFEERYEPVNRPSPPPESAGDSRKARGFADPFDTGRFG